MNGSESCSTHAVHVMWRSCVLTAYGLRSWSVDCRLVLVLLARFGWVSRGCRLRGCILSGRLRMHIRNRWFACLRDTSFATFTFSPFGCQQFPVRRTCLFIRVGGACALADFNWSRNTLSLFAVVRWELQCGVFFLDSAVLIRQCVGNVWMGNTVFHV